MSARGLIRKSNVTLICTTDDPIDSLCYHKAIAEDQSFSVQVLPAWRADRSIAIEKPDFAAYMEQLSSVSHIEINSFPALCKALKVRLDFLTLWAVWFLTTALIMSCMLLQPSSRPI